MARDMNTDVYGFRADDIRGDKVKVRLPFGNWHYRDRIPLYDAEAPYKVEGESDPSFNERAAWLVNAFTGNDTSTAHKFSPWRGEFRDGLSLSDYLSARVDSSVLSYFSIQWHLVGSLMSGEPFMLDIASPIIHARCTKFYLDNRRFPTTERMSFGEDVKIAVAQPWRMVVDFTGIEAGAPPKRQFNKPRINV